MLIPGTTYPKCLCEGLLKYEPTHHFWPAVSHNHPYTYMLFSALYILSC
jgi:hypothetical protein